MTEEAEMTIDRKAYRDIMEEMEKQERIIRALNRHIIADKWPGLERYTEGVL